MRTLLAVLLLPLSALAATPFTSNHPEEAHSNDSPMLVSPGDYAPLFKAVQERLVAEGFDAGPANGDFGTKTQAALTQFQLARNLPASGSLDQRTLNELGVDLGLSLSGGE
jgi:peptidoglycan hydrolase-like protein with peptidoglycan-binding domain